MSNGLEDVLECASELVAHLSLTGDGIRENSKEVYGRLLDAHMGVTGAIGSALKRRNLEKGNTSDSISARLLVMGTFVQGIDICESAISEGLYIQAAALLKQEMETVAAIEEINAGVRQDGRTPNVGRVRWGIGTLYGSLNEASHVAKESVLDGLLGMDADEDKAKPVSFIQQFDAGTAKRMYGLHVSLLSLFALELNQLHEEVYGEGFNEVEFSCIGVAVDALLDEGILTSPDRV